MTTIHAVYGGGVFRPTEPVILPEGTEVDVFPREKADKAEATESPREALAKIYAVLGERYASGHTDTAARHNEHEP